MKNLISYFFIFFATPFFCYSQKNDTLALVKVKATTKASTTNTAIPTQVLSKNDLQNSNSIADAMKQFAGVQVKDYGGVGGLKTLSVRSLGANHTGILYDGFLLGDAQGGQIDLGKFSLDNVAQIQLNNGNSTELLLPARAFASASLLSIKTSTNILQNNEKQALQLKLQQGAFGLFSPSITFKTRVTKTVQTSLHGWYMQSKNEYPYLSYENENQIEKRTNSDVTAYRLEYDALCNIKDSNIIKLKLFYFNSQRGLPGSIILYNNTSNQRLNDENIFAQASWQYNISVKSDILLGVKFSNDKVFYKDAAYPNSAGKLENKFNQQEKYLSAVYKYNFSKLISASFSADVFNSKLNRTDTFVTNFATPSRNTFLQNVAIKIQKSRLEMVGNLLLTTISEKVINGVVAKNIQQLTPAIAINVQPFKNNNFYLRAFYKNVFRAPTFNDLYYTNIGNVDLRPEFASQLNVGVTLKKQHKGFFQNINFTIDGYINKVSDKILAVPRQNLFQWSIQNIGKVNIKGIDVTMQATTREMLDFNIAFALSYTYQQSIDVSNKSSDFYKTQLPYTPMHTGNVSVQAKYKNINVGYNILLSSYRYRQGAPIAENFLKGWSSSDLLISYHFKKNYKLTATANNIFNNQYEIIRYYPMPGFSYNIILHITFKHLKTT